MEKNLIFAFYMMLSNHMWEDENTPPRYWYLKPGYRPEIDIEESAWDAAIDYVAEKGFNTVVIDVGDGIKFDSHPEISAPNAWSSDKLLEKLNAMRDRGLTPIPKLNFSAAHHTWLKEYRRMLSTSKYYEVCADLIREVCEIFGHPQLFHLGMDEENAFSQSYREALSMRTEKLYWHDSYFYFEQCEKQGARPWVWSDYCWDHPDLFRKYMPKSVLQSNWYYGMSYREPYSKESIDKAVNAYEYLADLGYDQVPTSSTWSQQKNSYQTLYYWKHHLPQEHLCGFMTASWYTTTESNLFLLKNDALRMWEARRAIYPETFS